MKNLSEDEKADIKFNGVDIFLSCDDPIDAAQSALGMIILFAGHWADDFVPKDYVED